MTHTFARARHTLVLLLAAAVLASGCSNDDDETGGSTAPPPPGPTIDVPGDAATIEAALALATARATIRVAPGIYPMEGPLSFGTGLDGVALVGDELDRPVLDFSSARLPVDSAIEIGPDASGVTIDGLTLRGGFTIGVEINADATTVRGCRIENAGNHGVSSAGTIRNLVIENNVIVAAGQFGLRFVLGASGSATGNTIAETVDCGIYTDRAGPMLARNLIVHTANYGVACFGTPAPSLSCNNLFDSREHYSPGCTPGGSDVHEDPLFCDEFDYELSADSPCAPGNSGACGRIGAMGVGCEPITPSRRPGDVEIVRQP